MSNRCDTAKTELRGQEMKRFKNKQAKYSIHKDGQINKTKPKK